MSRSLGIRKGLIMTLFLENAQLHFPASKRYLDISECNLLFLQFGEPLE